MRTGLIHLTGLAATLLLLLTLIAWVDSYSHYRYVGVQHDYPPFGAVSGRGYLAVGWNLFWTYDDAPTILGMVFDGGEMPEEMAGILESRGEQNVAGIGYLDHRPRNVGASHEMSGLIAPHWFVATCLLMPTAVYLRFLYRRRHPPASAPRSEEADGAESLDGVSSHTS